MKLVSSFSERLAEAMNEMSVTDLAIKLGISKQSVSAYLNGTRTPKRLTIASIAEILSVDPAWLSGYDTNKIAKASRPRGVRIPVYGDVAAGVPIEAITDYDYDDPDDWEEITEEMAADGTYFALRIKGDSMEPKFSPGDVVIVRVQDYADSGDIVIAMINGDEATCKKLQKSADGIMLVSFNPAYAPMYFSRKQCMNIPVRILGRVVELRAKF